MSLSIKKNRRNVFSSDFVFSDPFSDGKDSVWHNIKQIAKQGSTFGVLDDKILQTRQRLKYNKNSLINADSELNDGNNTEDSFIKPSDNVLTISDKLKTKARKRKIKISSADNFFDTMPTFSSKVAFDSMNLSRPLLKAVNEVGYVHPTPIQSACIPVVLLGRDVCACAATGTGKTAAFMLPILERLMYRPKSQHKQSMSDLRVLVLCPTRELAIQVYSVSIQLAQFTNINIALSTGGLDTKQQEVALRRGSDIIVATPGRLIDHLLNTPNFSLSTIEVLVLDEADRMLDEYFAEQMKQVINLCSRTRQTLLFSATMTDEVKDLVTVSLQRPVKVFINENTRLADNLRQEFVRIRPQREADREAIVAALLLRSFPRETMLFVQTKKLCHRLHIVLGLLGLSVAEMHGNLSQAQRIEAFERFKNGEIGILITTDLAARGLDIEDVKTVINLTLPATYKQYIHRVGRTARAGRAGRAVSLCGEQERKVLRQIAKHAHQPLKQRILAQDIIEEFKNRIEGIEKEIAEIENQELTERAMRAAEIQVNHVSKKLSGEGNNRFDHSERQWFQTKKEKQDERNVLNLSRPKKFRNSDRKLNQNPAEKRIDFELKKMLAYQVRVAKRQRRPQRMRSCDESDNRKEDFLEIISEHLLWSPSDIK